ncbi:hypothetical protein DID88_002115 [Monilinia fructigena]|uniref:Midasin n=1 Tax=Monilinia fructigena TaxID=38457 RepID=A0A395IXT3_9HELO|nr:hypothetical protein DID88_002115 [Monilinia fructigena]
MLGARMWQRVPIQMATQDEFREIIEGTYPILRQFLPGIISVYERLYTLSAKPSFASKSRASIGRPISPRDLLKWCRRLASVLKSSGSKTGSEPISDSTKYEMFLEAADCFAGSLQTEDARRSVISCIAEEMHIDPQSMEHFITAHIPRYDDGDNDLLIGRVRLSKKRSSRVSKPTKKARPFANTTHAKRLLEQVGVAVQMSEPVLLVGETGIGKTTVVQQLADSLGFKLTAVTVSTKSLAIPLKDEFDDLFASTGISATKNQKYIDQLGKCVAKSQWNKASKLWREAPKMFEKIISELAKKRRVKYACSLRATHKETKDRIEITGINEIEVTLVKILTEFRPLIFSYPLAPKDLLFHLSKISCMVARVLLLFFSLKTGEIERIQAHPDFRIFGAMNPATDVGKRDLPMGLRSRFTELYVDSPDTSLDDLLAVIKAYLKGTSSNDDRAAHDVARLYMNTKRLAEEKRLVDGANEVPHFSLRTLTRVLSYVTEIAPSYGLRRALYEGFAMGFLTLLDRESEKMLMPLIEHHLLDSHGNPQALLAQTPKHPEDGKQYVRFMNKKRDRQYWMLQGYETPQEQPHYIITPFVERNMLNLVRATSTRRFPVLIQGPTSSGKTSMIEYLAKFSGNKFVRINNHEHTDLQEYLGTYVSDSDGKLRFQEGLLVQALRQGHWIVLDELNLAPTDVLEALNRLLDDNHELDFILEKRSQKVAPSDCRRIVAVYKELSRLRQSTRLFEQKDSFATLRDLFRWALRDADNREHLAANGYMLLAERVRQIDIEDLYSNSLPEIKAYNSTTNSQGVVWTQAMRRLYVLVAHALRNNEPVLLVGETGCGKTTVCQMLAEAFGKTLHIVNAHQNTETGDLIGAQRPVRNRAAVLEQLKQDLLQSLNGVGQETPIPTILILCGQYTILPETTMSQIPTELSSRIQDNQIKAKALFEWSTKSPLSDHADVIHIVESKAEADTETFSEPMVKFAEWFGKHTGLRPRLQYQFVISWQDQIMNGCPTPNPHYAVLHGAPCLHRYAWEPIQLLSCNQPRNNSRGTREMSAAMSVLLNHDVNAIYFTPIQIQNQDDHITMGGFSVAKQAGSDSDPGFAFEAPTTKLMACGPLTRINLSEQTDLMDLFGSDVPVEGAEAGHFAWRDAPFLQAMQRGEWVLLDEMNLASQSVLEGLNACLDHRGEVCRYFERQYYEFVFLIPGDFSPPSTARTGELIARVRQLAETCEIFASRPMTVENAKFEWVDGVLIKALEQGKCINEHCGPDGEPKIVKPHANFRIFLTMDPRFGELSRAMRNRAVEIFLDPLAPENEPNTVGEFSIRPEASLERYRQASKVLDLEGADLRQTDLINRIALDNLAWSDLPLLTRYFRKQVITYLLRYWWSTFNLVTASEFEEATFQSHLPLKYGFEGLLKESPLINEQNSIITIFVSNYKQILLRIQVDDRLSMELLWNQLRPMVARILSRLTIEVIGAHGEKASNDYLSRKDIISSQVSTESWQAIRLDKFYEVISAHQATLFGNRPLLDTNINFDIDNAIFAMEAANNVPQYNMQYSALAWVHFAVGCIALYVPDRAFDPDKRQRLERQRHEEVIQELQEKLDALQKFERLFSGQESNIRCQLLEAELVEIGEPPAASQQVYRPEISELDKLQGEFRNLLKVVLPSPSITSKIHQLGLYMATLSSNDPSNNSKAALALSKATPFLGGTPKSIDDEIVSGQPLEYLTLMATTTSVEPIDSIDTQTRELLFTSIHSCYEQWTKKLESDRLEGETKAGLYRFRGSAEDEDEIDQEQFNELFPSYDEENPIAQSAAPQQQNVRDIAVTLAHVHGDIFLGGELPSKSIMTLIKHISTHIGKFHGSEAGLGDQNIIKALLPGSLLLLSDKIDDLSSSATVPESYNFYTDANLPETRKLVSLIHQVQTRFRELQAVDEIAHMQPLEDVMVSCKELLKFRHTEPLAKIITKVEKVHSFMHEWQFVNWRRLELSTWAKLFDMENKQCDDDARSWWFVAYQVIIAGPLSICESIENSGLCSKTSAGSSSIFSTAIMVKRFLAKPMDSVIKQDSLMKFAASEAGTSYLAPAQFPTVDQFSSRTMCFNSSKLDTETQEIINVSNTWLPNILSVGLELVNTHAKLGRVDSKPVVESLSSWKDILVDLRDGRHDAAEQLAVDLGTLIKQRPDLSFIIDQILPWTTINSSSAAAVSTQASLEALDQKLSTVCNTILAAMEKYHRSINDLPTSTEDQDQASFEILRHLDLVNDNVSRGAGAIFALLFQSSNSTYNTLEESIARYATLHRSTCKTSYILSKTFTQIASQGFCTPSEKQDAQMAKLKSWKEETGLGDGEGAEDIAKISQDAVDMADGEMEGEMGEAEEKEDDEGSGDEDKDGEEMDEEAGDVDDLDPNAVDEKMWDVAAQETNKEAGEGDEGEEGEEEEEEMAGAEQNEGEALDLPDDMQLDGEEKEGSDGSDDGMEDGMEDLPIWKMRPKKQMKLQMMEKKNQTLIMQMARRIKILVMTWMLLTWMKRKTKKAKDRRAGEKAEEEPGEEEQQPEDQDGLLRDRDDEATADAENAVPSDVQGVAKLREMMVVKVEIRLRIKNPLQRTVEKGRQAAGDAPQDAQDDTQDSSSAQPFKKLGDALEKWHRQQSQIREPTEEKDQTQDQNIDMGTESNEFQHLQDEDAEADTQA